MRIKKIVIDSFGGVRNWNSPDLDDHLVVIYGPNESGKSTISEFIISTLFPSRNVKYPVASKTDSGMLVVEMKDGDTRALVRGQKRVTEGSGKKTVDEEFPNLDAYTYRSLYGLDLDRLTDSKIISSSDFRSKFLTVPGGEMVPEVSDEIEKHLDSLMTKEKITENKTIGRLMKEIRTCDQRIAEIQQHTERYDGLSEEREVLRKKVEEKKYASKLIMDVHAKKEILKSQTANLERLNELKSTRNDYERYRGVPLDSKNQFEILKARIDALQPDAEGGSDFIDYTDVLDHKEEIEAAWNGRDTYLSNVESVRRIDSIIEDYRVEISQTEKLLGWTLNAAKVVKIGQDVTEHAENEMRRKERKGSLLLGLVLMLMGMASVTYFGVFADEKSHLRIFISLGIALIGAATMVAWVRGVKTPSKKWRNWVTLQGYPSYTTPERLYSLSMKLEKLVALSKEMDNSIMEKEEIEQQIADYVNSVFPLFSSLNCTLTNIDSDLVALHDTLIDAENSVTIGENSVNEFREKKMMLTKFLRPYGDENGFLEAYAAREELDRLDTEIKTLTQSIEASTMMSINDLNTFFDDEEGNVEKEDFDTSGMDHRIGEIESEMRSIMDDGEIDDLLQKRTNSENALDAALREWAVYSIAESIVKDACDHFYTDLQPNVIKNANEYLSLMTDGRYLLDSDPRENEIAVKDEYMKKTANRWSSGLGDQIYLSLKMAMAKEMGLEKMPFILDDVLVRFDDERKMGACRAIYKFSRENQTLIFTCENTLRNFFNICGSHTEIRL